MEVSARRCSPLSWFVVVLGPLLAVPAMAAFNDSGSILVFPHVEATGDWDTTIQVINTSTYLSFAECRYIDGSDGLVADPFVISLRAQQPTHWIASRGRAVDASDPICELVVGNMRCDGAGLDPGRVPPIGPDFRGYLHCVQIDRSGAPVSGNAFAGTATLRASGASDVAKYEAIQIGGLLGNNADSTLCHGGEPSDDCPSGAEYEPCPRQWHITLAADALASAPGLDLSHRASLTFLPCGLGGDGEPIVIQIIVINEFEQQFSFSAAGDTWFHAELKDINQILPDAIGSDLVYLQARSGNGVPLLMLGQIDRDGVGGTARSFLNAHPTGESAAVTVLEGSARGRAR